MLLIELFDAPYEYRRQRAHENCVSYVFDTKDGPTDVLFDKMGPAYYADVCKRFGLLHNFPVSTPNSFEVVFFRGGYGITDEGDAPKIFATVLAIIRDFIKREGAIAELYFTASEPSRVKLYRAMAKRLATDFTVKTAEPEKYYDNTAFLLTRK